MKTSTLSTITFTLLFATAFLFTGCNTDENGVDSHSVVSPQAINNPNVPQTRQSPEAESDPVITKILDADIVKYLDAVNAARAETQDCGSEGIFDPAPPVTWNNRLSNAAWEHSNDLAQSNTFSHTGSGTLTDVAAQEMHLGHGSQFSDRIENQGYTQYRTIGENIAAGYIDAQDVVEGWLESDHHCANLMNPKFSEVGMALVEKTGTEYGSYWSQEFGGQ